MTITPLPADSSPRSTVRLLLLDAHDRSRHSSRALLEANPGWTVVGESGDLAEGLEMADQLAPDVVLLSMRVHGSTGPEAARLLRKNHPEMKVLFLTLFEGVEYVKAAMATGAHGYALKQAPAAELFTAIETVLRGDQFWADALSRQGKKP